MSKRGRVRSTTAELQDELPVEEVAARLGLPVAMLVRRIEAGTVPGRKLDGPDGVTYCVPVAALPPVDETAEVLPSSAANGKGRLDATASAPESPRPHGEARGGDAVGGDAGEDLPVVVVPSKQVIEASGHPVNGEAVMGAVVHRADPAPSVELARQAVLGTGIDARELVAALLDRWERTYAQRIDAEYQLRYDSVLAEERARQQRLRGKVEALQGELASLAEARQRDIGRARAMLAERDRDLAALREQFHTRLQAILDRDRLLAERDRVISARDRLVHQLRDEVGEKDRLLSDLRELGAQAPKQARRRRGLFGS